MRARTCIAAASVMLCSVVANADDVQTRVFVSAPLIVGVNQHLSINAVTDSVVGVRPELIIARAHENYAWGLGVYGDAIDVNGDETWFGGGATAVIYRGYFGAAVSAGVDARVAGGVVNAVPVFGGFFGVRIALERSLWHSGFPFDLPLGVRVDARPGYDMIPTSIAFQFQLDVIFATTLLVMVLAHGDIDK